MSRMSLRAQVIAGVAAVHVVAFAIGGALILDNAREAIRAEVAAGEKAARALAIATVGALRAAMPEGAVAKELESSMAPMRHVRVAVITQEGLLTVPNAETGPVAPQWLVNLLAPPHRETRLPIIPGRPALGQVVLSAAPEDEIAEFWADLRALGMVLPIGLAASLLLVGIVVGRATRPLKQLDFGLATLERGDHGGRIDAAAVREVAPILARFNALASRLSAVATERDALSRRIVAVSDAERRAISMELHDEFGPCLFGLEVKAEAIQNRAGDDPRLAADARALLDITAQIKATNRRLLRSLRPTSLGQLPLPDVLRDMVEEIAARHQDVVWEIDLPADLPEMDETTELTVYRVVQEAVTNALRHARPSRISVRLESEAPLLRITVADDGPGIPKDQVGGTGLRAMKERLVAIGGHLDLGAFPGGRLVATIPAAQALTKVAAE